jgi:hypothetical protein
LKENEVQQKAWHDQLEFLGKNLTDTLRARAEEAERKPTWPVTPQPAEEKGKDSPILLVDHNKPDPTKDPEALQRAQRTEYGLWRMPMSLPQEVSPQKQNPEPQQTAAPFPVFTDIIKEKYGGSRARQWIPPGSNVWPGNYPNAPQVRSDARLSGYPTNGNMVNRSSDKQDARATQTSEEQKPARPRHLKSSFAHFDNSLLMTIVSYLPIREVTILRTLNSKLFEVAQLVIPVAGPGLVFIRFEWETNRGKRFDYCVPSPGALRWSCGACSTVNRVNATNCRRCQACYLEGHGTRRVFFGQLRKDRTAELVDWIIALVCPQIKLCHVENHTNGVDGRGKGCAWVYVANEYDEQRLLTLNKRMFVDVDDDGREGIWYCSPDFIESLGVMASRRSCFPNRPIVLARQPLVVERPQIKSHVKANVAGMMVGQQARTFSVPQPLSLDRERYYGLETKQFLPAGEWRVTSCKSANWEE